MRYKKGDEVIYTYNRTYDDHRSLLKRPIGIVDEEWDMRDIPMLGCNWTTKDGETFYWNVPKSYTKLINK